MSASSPPQILSITTTSVHSTALSSLSLPPQPPPTHALTQPPATIPYSKLIPSTRFIVDGFKIADSNFSVSYFLSHFHSDHYTGLTPQWTKGIIFCSFTTSLLLHQILGIPKPFICAIPLCGTILIDGVEVSVVDANHCPGAVQFLFKVPELVKNVGNSCDLVKFRKYVHTGDFRYCVEMKNEKLLCDFVGADAVFLDTTYCHPKFMFPIQEESIDYIVGVINARKDEYKKENAKNVLFLLATYVVGKEKLLVEVSRRCNRKIYVSGKKMAVLEALGYGDSGVFTMDELQSDIHVVSWNVLGETWPYFRPNFVNMKEIMSKRGYSKVVGFVPTGWTYEVKKNKFSVRTKDAFEIHLVPYSEHSNYEELREYVKFLKPKRVLPTVGSDVEKVDSKHVSKMCKHFSGLVDEKAIKNDFLMGFFGGVSQGVSEGGEVEDEDALLNQSVCGDAEMDIKNAHALDNVKESDVEESIKEFRDCLPNWVTRTQMLGLLEISGGNVVEAVSNFFEHETKFHAEVLPSTLVSCTFQDSPENQFPLSFESPSVKSIKSSEDVSSSQQLKVSSPLDVKKAANSSGKRKKTPDSKTTKRARADPSQRSINPKQLSITNFFQKKVPVILEHNKVDSSVSRSSDDQRMSSNHATEPYKEEVDTFIQIVNGCESLRSYAATVLEKAKGDINMALDLYYRENGDVNNQIKDNIQDSSNLTESECSSRTVEPAENKKLAKCDSMISEPSDSKTHAVKYDICYPRLSKDNAAENFISLPPDKYSPTEHACWKKGEPAPYLHMARTFELVEEEKGKLKASSMLCNMFRSLLALSPDDVLPAVYLCTNKIAPDHENMELNIGASTVVAALEEACGTKRSKINNLYNSLGDLGDVAQLCRQTQSQLAPPAALTIKAVYSALRKISAQTGSGSAIRKKSLIMSLMCSCREKEMKFLVRTLVRNLRIGAMMRTILPALAQAIVMNSANEGIAENLKYHIQTLSGSLIEAYNILPTLDILIPSLINKGIEFSSSTLSMVPGIPIKPMLAKVTNGVPQVLKLFSGKAFTCEYKYDGQRAQIHKLADGSIHVFSRSGDETTSRFPDLVEVVKGSCSHKADTFILDVEVVAIDRKNNLKLLSFQELSSRERGNKDSLITVDKIKVDICIFAFDIMLFNGEQLLYIPLRERRKYLKDVLTEEKAGYFEYATEMTVESEDADSTKEATLNKMSNFLDDAIRSSCEGIMVKCLDVDAGYTPSQRSDAWLKVKRDYVEGLNDSLDLVPIGAWYGNGRKAGWFSPFLLACYNPDTEEFQSVCRVMSGFSDAFYIEMKEYFSGERILSKKPPYYRTGEVPDMWFSPELVWQIRGADFTISPVHQAAVGLVHPSRGISIRFPRFIRTVSDRRPEECNTSSDIADMFSSQTRKIDVSTTKN